jgi:hypothetical protein
MTVRSSEAAAEVGDTAAARWRAAAEELAAACGVAVRAAGPATGPPGRARSAQP